MKSKAACTESNIKQKKNWGKCKQRISVLIDSVMDVLQLSLLKPLIATPM